MKRLALPLGPTLLVAALVLGAVSALVFSGEVRRARREASDSAKAALELRQAERDAALARRLAEVWLVSEQRVRERLLEASAAERAALGRPPYGFDVEALLATDRPAVEQRARVLVEAVLAEAANADAGAAALSAESELLRFDTWALPLAALGMFGLLAWWLVDRIVERPARRLVRAMDEVAAGGVQRASEAGALPLRSVTAAFNRMADALFSARRDLEARVDAKTAALGQALQEQRALNERLERTLAELHAAQERAIRQEKMAAIGTLAGGVAHEFNNLLGGIRGCAEQALDDTHEPDVRQGLEVIVRAARRGRTIVDGLLRFSQGAQRTPRILDLGGAAGEVASLVARTAAEKGVEIQCRAERAAILADPVEVQQVLLNLVQNAIQAAPEGSAVEIAVGCEAGSAHLEVRDRGPGIPEELRTRIFEPFFTTRERDGGTGLGLAITVGIVQSLGGTLTFRAREGGGTVFVAELPSAAASMVDPHDG